MRSVLLSLASLLLLVVTAFGQSGMNVTCVNKGMKGSFYDFQFPLLNGTVVNFTKYQNKVVLVSNMATYCGMTVTNYNEDNQLYTKYASRGFEILGFPSPNFNNQEPGKDDEILNGLKYVRPGGGYVPLFTLFAKSDVNGASANRLYPWLKSRCGPPSTSFTASQFVTWNPVLTTDITWNFEKFLLDHNGNIFKRYTPQTSPSLLSSDIEYLLNGGTAPM